MAASAVLHLALLVIALGLSRGTTSLSPAEERRQPSEATRIDMIYMPPPPPVATPTQPEPEVVRRPPPPLRRTDPEPEPNAPPDAVRSSGDQETSEASPTDGTPKTETAEATLESEARRIFGRPRLATRPGAGPQAIRPMEAWAHEHPERCIPHPTTPRDSAGPVQLGTVVGRIFRQDNGQPLSGAHLQMIGTPYVTFTDGAGEYRFRFDLALVDDCRTQYVRVSAAGYESRLLVLVVGPHRSEDVRLRRR